MPRTDPITTVDDLEERLSAPSPDVIGALGRLQGDILLLGAGGKMGPSLARMAQRASDEAGICRRVIAVSRFSSSAVEANLHQHGIETIRCELLDAAQLDALPEAANVVWMTGYKFGATGQEALAWAMNAWLPGVICRRFLHSRIVAFSTGNVYGLSPVLAGGSVEEDPLRPIGDYSMSCVGRERIFEYFSRTHQIPMILLRLNYANELRYGVLADLARKVWTGEVIELTMGHFNALWQGDANAWALQSFDHVATPPRILNLAGPELLSVRHVAEEFGRLLDRAVTLGGVESTDAYLSNSSQAIRRFGYPRVGVQQLMEWIAAWVRTGGASLERPTHFEVRDGSF
jgi:hypothetical protein